MGDDSEVLESVCFFLPTGKTFTFRNVVIATDNETTVVIHYTAASDGRVKQATFYKAQFVGMAICRRNS